MALELLRTQGYDIETTHFASPDLSVAALANGQMDIGNGSTRTLWAAISKGAPLRTVMEQTGTLWSLVTSSELAGCDDLGGKRLAVNSAGSISKALLDAYLQKNCPDIKPEIMFIPGSDNRVVALQTGEIGGALLELADALELERQAPGRFRSLVNYAQAFPRLKTTGVHVNRAFAEKYPDSVRDYVRAMLTVHRQIKENPQPLKDALVKYLGVDAGRANEMAGAYLKSNLWDVNGGLTREDVQYSVEFFTTAGSLSEGLNAERVADLSYLNAVLDEIGRK